MENDENLTFQSYELCELVLTNLLEKYKGRIFNTAGDSVLAEFSSAVDAVECAAEFQAEIRKKNESNDSRLKLEFRVGINVGDVVSKGDNFLGDGVNIAARLEAFAQPNGISISKSVYDLVRHKTKLRFHDLGMQRIKNNEFHAIDVLLDLNQKRILKSHNKLKVPLLIGTVSILILVFSGIFYFTFPLQTENTLMDKRVSSLPVILVAPIRASGVSENQKSFANGITESLIATLSSYRGVKVLSSSTSFYVEKMEMSDEEIRDQYDVDSIIRGSMQVIDKSARLHLEISDLHKSEVVISRKKDFNLNDIFQVQDRLSNEILKAMQINVGNSGEQTANKILFNSMEEYTTFLNWRIEWKKGTEEGYYKSLDLINQLQSSNPKLSLSVWLAWQLQQKINLGLSTDKEADLKEIARLIEESFLENKVDKAHAFAARALIGLMYLQRSCQDSINDADEALNISGTVDILTITGYVYGNCDRHKKAVEILRRALRLVPNDNGWFITRNLVQELFKNKQYKEIYTLVADKMESVDMKPSVLAIFSYLEYKNGNKREAKKYWRRAKKEGYTLDRSFYVKTLKADIREDLLETISKIDGQD